MSDLSMIARGQSLTSKVVKEGLKGSQNQHLLLLLSFSFGKIEANTSLSAVRRLRSGQGEVEGVKTDPGRARGDPPGTKNASP